MAPNVLLAFVMTIVVAASGCGRAKLEPMVSVVSVAKARRIAAIWGGEMAYLPARAPAGVALSDWLSSTCACGTYDRRLEVRFRRRSALLVWEVTSPTEVNRVRQRIACRDGEERHVVNGRAVFYSNHRGVEVAWTCISRNAEAGADFPSLVVSIRQRPSRAGSLRRSELEKMVASARPSPPGRALGRRFELPVAAELSRMVAAFRRRLLVPRVLPRGFIFSGWHVMPAGGIGRHRRSLTIDFGRDGLLAKLAWTISSGVDQFELDCPSDARRFTPTARQHAARIRGRRLYAIEGIHGVRVWTCIRQGAVGNAEPLEVAIWYDIRLHSRTMLRLAMRMIAGAQVVRE